jgi:endoglucanase
MKHLLVIVSFLYGCLPAKAQPVLTEIRTASPTVLVAFFHDPTFTGQVWQRGYSTNAVSTNSLLLWKLNGTPVMGIAGEFVTEANGSDYHIYLTVPQLVNGTPYSLTTPCGNTNFVFSDTNIFCESIKVNQNGYSALSQVRYANLAIWLGTGGAKSISGSLPTYTVFNWFTGRTVAQGTISPLFQGVQDTSSGDYVYRIDLSGVPAGGPYKVSVSGYGCSYPFGVGGNFSQRLAYVAFRGLYYQRCGCPIVQPYAWANIRPTPCHTTIYDNESPDNPSTGSINTSKSSTPLVVHGGYHDASNPPRNPYALIVPITLMTTYEVFPNVFTDQQFNIPDEFDANFNIIGSGNGIPDILDEAMWCLMAYTNLQSTSKEPVGAVAWGTASNQDPGWGQNFDSDSLTYSTETNNKYSSGMAAGAFMHMARLIQPYNPQLSTNLQQRADQAIAAAGGLGYSTANANFQHQLYYSIEKYLLTGDVTASNTINNNYSRLYQFTNSYNTEAGGFLSNDGQFWMASYFMSYIVATNRYVNPTIVSYFKTYLQAAADQEIAWLNGDAYPVGWPTNADPVNTYHYFSGFFTSQGQFAYPCLMQWAVSGTQKYIDAVSLLMDYDQGLNPLGKCYLTGIGFNRVNNPEQRESIYAQNTMGWGGPQPGITIYGPGRTQSSVGANTSTAAQVPNANTLPRERIYVDDLGNWEWNEFTDYQCLSWPAAIYPVLAQGGTWSPAREPFLNPAASISVVSNGLAFTFGALPGQTTYVQVSSSAAGPWSDLSGPLLSGTSSTVQFTDTTPAAPAVRFYRTRWAAPIY